MPVEAELDDLLDRAASRLLIGRALRDSEEQLTRSARSLPLPCRPERRQANGVDQVLSAGRRAHVQAHGDVRAELRLDVGDRLGREALLVAVVDRAERHALFVHFEDRVAQREDLIAARVGEDRAVPAHELMKAAELSDHVLPGAEMEVVGVAEQDLGAERAQLDRIDHLHGRLRADGHERRRAELPVRGLEHSGTRLAVGGGDPEAHLISIASPNE